MEVLNSKNISTKNLSLFDFGAGPGYFLSAASGSGISNFQGCEISKEQKYLADKFIGKGIVDLIEEGEYCELVSRVKENMISRCKTSLDKQN